MFLQPKPSLLPPFLSAIAVALPIAAAADVTVQEQTTLNVSIIKANGTRTQQIADEMQRTESELRCEGMMSLLCDKARSVNVVRLDRGVSWKFEPKKERYTETPLPTPAQSSALAVHTHAAAEKLKSCPAAPQTAQAIDTSKCELEPATMSIEQTNETARFADHDAQRTNLKLIQKCKAQDPTQACELTYLFEVWFTRDPVPALDARRDFQRRYLTHLGLADSAGDTSGQFEQYLAPYAGAMQQLAEKSAALKGYPLKTTFRMQFAGQPCGVARPATNASGGTVADARSAAVDATASSTQHAAGWGTADAVERSTKSGMGGYIAGSAAGAFTQKLVGDLLSMKSKPREAKPAVTAAGAGTPAPTTIVEFTVETLAISAEPIPAKQFEVPAGWKKSVMSLNADPPLPACPSTGT